MTTNQWPAHLRDDAPAAVCSGCRRRTVAMAEFAKTCRMTQPDGTKCAGVFSDPGDISKMMSELDELRTRAFDSSHALIIEATAATIHEVAGWGGNVTSAEMHELAERIRTDDPKDWTCCPLCEEVRCDEPCSLLPVRRDLGVM